MCRGGAGSREELRGGDHRQEAHNVRLRHAHGAQGPPPIPGLLAGARRYGGSRLHHCHLMRCHHALVRTPEHSLLLLISLGSRAIGRGLNLSVLQPSGSYRGVTLLHRGLWVPRTHLHDGELWLTSELVTALVGSICFRYILCSFCSVHSGLGCRILDFTPSELGSAVTSC